MPNRLKFAVIGAGNMGRHHIGTLAELENEVVLVAICDTKENMGKALAREHDAVYYRDYLDMLEREEIDIVSVCVPTRIHHQVGKDCILKGLNILLEKPICLQVESAEELLGLARQENVTLLVGHTERFNPAVIKAKEIIDSGAIGEITRVNARRLGGLPAKLEDNTVAIDLAIHDIDIINLLLDDYPSHISVEQRRTNPGDQEDYVEFSLQYQSAGASITASWASPEKIRKLEIVGSKGSLKLDYIDQEIALYVDPSGATPELVFDVPWKQPLKEEISHLINCVRESREIDSTYAVDALRIATDDDRKVRS